MRRIFWAFHKTFLYIRENIIRVTEYWKEHYLKCFEVCKVKILKDFHGPVRYRIAIRHYKAVKKYNSDHNLKDDAQILKIVILDEKYQTLLTNVVVGNVISEDGIIENFVSAAKVLLTSRYPYHLIKQKLINDLKMFGMYSDFVRMGNEFTNLTAEYKKILEDGAPSSLVIKQLEAKLDQQIKDLKSFRDFYLSL